jgi:glycerophosphoryl diester phosphodiesterase
MSLKILGHRGMGATQHLAVVPPEQEIENTLASFEAAMLAGADGVEFDLWLTKDEKIVVSHGENAFRPAQKRGGLEHYTAAELQSIDLGRGERMPLFEDVLALFERLNIAYRQRTDANLTLLVELKNRAVIEPVQKIIDEFTNRTVFTKKDFAINSFDWEGLRLLRSLDKGMFIFLACSTMHLFDQNDILLPSYDTKIDAHYAPEKFETLINKMAEIKADGVDMMLQDVKPELFAHLQQHQYSLFMLNVLQRRNATRWDLLGPQLAEYARHLPCVFVLSDDLHTILRELGLKSDK